MTQKPRLTLLRPYIEGEEIRADEAATEAAIERMASDDELKAAYRQPDRWSYVVRDPTGAVPIKWGADTQEACLNKVIDQVADHVFDECLLGGEVWLKGWRFLLWPPDKR